MTTQQNQPDPKTPITLTLPLAAVEIVMASLGKMPYEQTYQVIDDIRNQAVRALQPAPAPEAPQAPATEGDAA
jgi:hypothetical protein